MAALKARSGAVDGGVNLRTLLAGGAPVWSQARKVIVSVLPFMASGKERNLSIERSSSEEVAETAPTSVHWSRH